MPSQSFARNKDPSNRHRAAGPSSCADRTAADQARFCSLRRSPTDPSARAPKRRRTAPDGPPAHNRRPPPARIVPDQFSKDENVCSCLKGNQIRPENVTTTRTRSLLILATTTKNGQGSRLSGCSAKSIRSLTVVVQGFVDLRRRRRDGIGCQSRSPPKFERDRQGIDADPGPPRGFIAVTVQIPMVQPADRDCVFIADLSTERTGLRKPNVMGLGRRAAAHDAWLSPDELTVLPVAQANGFRCNATAPDASVIRGTAA